MDQCFMSLRVSLEPLCTYLSCSQAMRALSECHDTAELWIEAAQRYLVMLCLLDGGLTNEDLLQGCEVHLPEVLGTKK